MASLRSVLFALSVAALLLPSPALAAKEQSKIQIALDPVAGGAAAGRNVAKLRTQFMPGRAWIHLHVKGLAPSTEHLLLSDGIEITRFTTNTKGKATLKVDLLALASMDFAGAPVDPRGTLVTVHDGTTDVLAGWLYGPVENDPSRVHVTESTFLAPDPLAAPSGTTIAHYMMTPNRKAKLRIRLVHAPIGDYEVWVDDVLVGEMSTNSAGNASADFRSEIPRGAAPSGKKSKKKLPLDFDPRLAWIELRMAGAPVFAGEMAAQIGGLNLCLALVTPLALAPAQPGAAGTLTLSIEDDCSRELAFSVSGLAPGSYDVVVAGEVVGALVAAADGTGAVTFDTSPEPGELPLEFLLPSGTPFSIEAGGVPALTGVMP